MKGGKMKRAAVLLIAVTGCLIAMSMNVHGDVVHLKSGGKIEGRIIRENDKEIRLEVEGGVIKIPRSAVARIEKAPWEAPPRREGQVRYRNMLLTKSQVEFLKRFKDLSGMPEGKVTETEGVAEEVLSIRTRKRESERFFVESDTLDQDELRITIRYLEKSHANFVQITGLNPEELRSEVYPLKVVLLTRRRFVDFIEAHTKDERMRKLLPEYSWLRLSRFGDWKGYLGRLSGDTRVEGDPSENFLDGLVDLLAGGLASLSGAGWFPEGADGGFCDFWPAQMFNSWGSYTRNYDDTAKRKVPMGRPLPHGMRYVRELAKNRKIVLKGSLSEIRDVSLRDTLISSANSIGLVRLVKSWAFWEYAILERPEATKKFFRLAREMNGSRNMYKPDEKQLGVIECLEEAFGSKVDRIEKDLRKFVRKTYRPPSDD